MKDENGNIVFDAEEQAKVDEIVKDRLARAKAEKPADYDDLSEIAKDLEDFGYSGTPAEKKAAIKTYKEQMKQQQELEELQKQAQEDGIDPKLAKKIKDLEDKLDSKTKELDEIVGERQAKKTEEEKVKQAEENWKNQVEEFNEEYPDIDVKDLENNEEFIDFIQGSGWTLKQAYKKFAKVYGEIEAKTAQKFVSKKDRSTSSGKGGEGGEGNYGLTQAQKDQLEQWNSNNPQYKMSAKEFKERLG